MYGIDRDDKSYQPLRVPNPEELSEHLEKQTYSRTCDFCCEPYLKYPLTGKSIDFERIRAEHYIRECPNAMIIMQSNNQSDEKDKQMIL